MYQQEQLSSGVRLLTVPLKESPTASLLVMVKAGSRDESESVAGISHFVEHLMFKGTRKRPTTMDLSKVLDGIGAEYNAFTDKNYTGYYIKADSRHLSLAIDVLSDMLLHSLFAADEIAREKGVIVEEINMYEDNPLIYVESLAEELIFGKHPLARQIAGSRESVKRTTRADILKYKNNFYNGRNVIIGLSGNFQASHLVELRKKFNFKRGAANNRSQKIKFTDVSPKVKINFKTSEQVQAALALPAYAYGDQRLYALQLMAIILGGNMSSRLFSELREKRGLAYFVRSWPSIYQEGGCLLIQAGLDKMRLEGALSLILSELAKLKKGVKLEELKRAQEYLICKVALDLEDTLHTAQWYCQQAVMGKEILTPTEKLRRFSAVTLADIKQVANELIDFSKLGLAVIGPFKDEGLFKKIIKS